jgi:hypothetical protein
VWQAIEADSAEIAKKHICIMRGSAGKPGSTVLPHSLWLMPRQSFGARIGYRCKCIGGLRRLGFELAHLKVEVGT